jgi:dephospho-CoA kinase
MSIIIGLTGGIASGKSTIAKMLSEKGFTIIDADVAARKVVEKGQEAYEQIIQTFGEEILLEDRTLDRTKLGSIVFNDESSRKQLNAIVHPAVRTFMLKEKEQALQSGRKTIIMDIPLLFESQLTWMVEKTIVVSVDSDIQIKRLMDRNHFSRKDALARIHSQLPLAEKELKADGIIRNNETIEESKLQLEQLIEKWHLIP